MAIQRIRIIALALLELAAFPALVLAQVPVWALAQELVARPELVLQQVQLAPVPVLELAQERRAVVSDLRVQQEQALVSLALQRQKLPLVLLQLAELAAAGQRSELAAWAQRHLVFGYLLRRLRHWMQLGHPLWRLWQVYSLSQQRCAVLWLHAPQPQLWLYLLRCAAVHWLVPFVVRPAAHSQRVVSPRNYRNLVRRQ
jgi:hypothetical protein